MLIVSAPVKVWVVAPLARAMATVGAVVQPGQELFRLIRQQRLEWRAELPSADLARVRPGMKAVAVPPGGQPIEGQVRMVAPTVDAATRNGLDICNRLFEVTGARATHASLRFDRHWRNLRTQTLHDPVDYRVHELGEWALSGKRPIPSFYS